MASAFADGFLYTETIGQAAYIGSLGETTTLPEILTLADGGAVTHDGRTRQCSAGSMTAWTGGKDTSMVVCISTYVQEEL